jgi:hypothetical protein
MNPDRIVTMRHLVIVLAVSGCVSFEPPILFQDAGVGAASTNSDYLDRPIKVCGQVVSDYRGPHGEWVLSHKGRYSMSWLVVHASAGPLPPGGEACVRGWSAATASAGWRICPISSASFTPAPMRQAAVQPVP